MMLGAVHPGIPEIGIPAGDFRENGTVEQVLVTRKLRVFFQTLSISVIVADKPR